MYINTGYLNQSHKDFKDKRQPLIVGSCGNYRLSSYPKMPTYRPRGRLDYQIIYIASGKAYFHFDKPENETIVPAGNVVLFRPKELQKYEYYGKDKTEVFWIHFTGSDVKNILRKYGFADKQRVFPVGTSLEYERIFKRIISELQKCQSDYEEMLMLLLRHLLIVFNRELTREHVLKNEYMDREMELTVSYFSTNYNLDINIEEYASSKGMSVSWFIHNFKKYTGETPMQFLTSIRITNAQILLETTTYSVNEISRIVGYNNPLYFSRIFHKRKGYSPQQYRKRMMETEE
ncbi:AraC family transcriptional regulator [Brotaphodocola sp.]|uniref:AraC family transcriptional regulator n=1 Tax=Brotaphodocola sp. TaxID=3073577 RepID=UPI003D7D4D67